MSISLAGLIVAILIFALIWYLIQMLPVNPKVKQVCIIVLIVVAILYLLHLAGLAPNVRIT